MSALEINIIPVQTFIQALLCTAIFHQRFSFFTGFVIKCLHEVLPWWAPKGKSLKFRPPDCSKIHFWYSFWLQKHSLHIVCQQQEQFFLELESLMGSFMRSSFITQFKIDFLLLFTGCRKVLGKVLAVSIHLLRFNNKNTRRMWEVLDYK